MSRSMRVGIGVVPGVAAGTPEYWLSFGVPAVASGTTSGPAIADGTSIHALVCAVTVAFQLFGYRAPDAGAFQGRLGDRLAGVRWHVSHQHGPPVVAHRVNVQQP